MDTDYKAPFSFTGTVKKAFVDVTGEPVEDLAAKMRMYLARPRHRINQLPCDANFPRCLAYSPLKDIAHAKPAPDFLDIDGFAFEGETRVARDHEQRFEPRALRSCTNL